jgi:very-short-patch-repair endonuclease
LGQFVGQDDRLRRNDWVIDRWKQSLVQSPDLLLDVGQQGVPIDADPVRIAFALAGGSAVPLEARELAGAGRGRWLGLGLLAYGEGRLAPVALWPVVLEQAELRFDRTRTPRVNDALVTALGVELPAIDDLAALLDAAAAHGTLHRCARLAAFSFDRLALARDLSMIDIANTPAAWLAGHDPMAAAPSLPASPVATSDLLVPLEADASQLAAIAAAGAGGSFVLQAAPGTGATQTVANLAVHCAATGKSVLVVADRPAALEAIAQRLAGAGLADVCVPLDAGRAPVLEFLTRALDRAFRPGAGPSGAEARLAGLRAELDGHVAAMHKVGPLGLSVHEVLGRLVELRTTPCAALAEGDAAGFDRATFERRRAAVTALATTATAVEPAASHPWRASALAVEANTPRAARALSEASAAADALASALAEVATLLPGVVARTREQLKALGALSQLAAVSPRPGAELLTNIRTGRADDIGEQVALIRARGGGTLEVPRDPATFLAIATRHRALVDEVAEHFAEPSALDAPELWTQLKRWNGSVAALRYVALRTARAHVRAAAGGTLDDDESMLAALEAVLAERACRMALEAAAEPARRWLGSLHTGGDALSLDLAAIEAATAWGAELRRAFDAIAIAGGEAARQVGWRTLVALVSAGDHEPGELAPFARLAEAVTRWEPTVAEVATATGIAPARLGAGADHLASLRDQLAVLSSAVGSLADWTRFHLARHAAKIAGVGPALTAVERGDLAADQLARAWERATLLAWLDAEVRATPALARFSGARHHSAVAAFSDLDRSALALTRARIVARLAERLPRGSGSVETEIATLRAEAAAPNGSPLRAVLAELTTLLPRLAPIVLATPLAIAEHLGASSHWDVVVFDDASRLPAAHALGALARARAAVLVGDARQLAPEDGLLEAACTARFPQLTLSTHYRSRHEDLFAFANRTFYRDALELAPAAYATPALGVSWRLVDGQPDVAGANRAEAEAVIAEAVRRVKSAQPRSLAIVAMSRAHADLIESLRPPELADVLVGTPDRIQGEDRDVALVTFGDLPAAFAHPGAERWLAVAATCAREQLVLFSSFDDAPGTLGELIAYARVPRIIDASEPASPVTAAIARALADRGWMVRHQVGTGRYRVDLAIVDPDDPQRYVLAIEHDGKAYASAGSARDRDRLRAQRLAQLGWRLHRVWTLDWWQDPDREIQRAHGAIVAAIAASRQRRSGSGPARAPRATGSAPVAAPPIDTTPVSYTADTAKIAALDPAPVPVASGSGPTDALIASSSPMRIPRGTIAIAPYAAAAIPPGRRAPDDMFAPRYLVELGKCVEQVLAVEAPIHIELLARRVAAYFGIGKVTPRVIEQVQHAVLGRGKWGDERGIVWRINQDATSMPPVRVPGSSAQARRSIAEVPLAELASAARVVVERSNGVASTDLVRDCARLLGFTRITSDVTDRVEIGIRLATARKLIFVDSGKAHIAV